MQRRCTEDASTHTQNFSDADVTVEVFEARGVEGRSGREVRDEKNGATRRISTAVPIVTLSIPLAIIRLAPPTPQSFRTRSNSAIETAVNMKTTTITSIIFGLAALVAALPSGKSTVLHPDKLAELIYYSRKG